ncbi:hypothetical protein DLJ49_18140 [Rhodovulum sp. 12E13]|nr:hypothetical protein DLJ49_18140 [Rhodovulum sp. 12E13]
MLEQVSPDRLEHIWGSCQFLSKELQSFGAPSLSGPMIVVFGIEVPTTYGFRAHSGGKVRGCHIVDELLQQRRVFRRKLRATLI